MFELKKGIIRIKPTSDPLTNRIVVDLPADEHTPYNYEVTVLRRQWDTIIERNLINKEVTCKKFYYPDNGASIPVCEIVIKESKDLSLSEKSMQVLSYNDIKKITRQTGLTLSYKEEDLVNLLQQRIPS